MRGNVVTLTLAASGVDLTTGSGAHVVVYIDAPPVSEGAATGQSAHTIVSAATQIPVSGLLVGRHTLTAVLADAGGTRLGSSAPSTSVTVDGPAVTAKIVGQVAAGHGFSLALSSYGVTISDIASDTSGRTAHYNVLIDRGTPRPGTVPRAGTGLIDTTGSLVPIPSLRAGTHDIWVVLVNGAGRTLSPLSGAEVVVKVA